MKNHSAARVLLAVMLLMTTPGTLFLNGCAIGPASAATFYISPASVSLTANQQQQFTVSVSTASGSATIDTGITWQVNNITGGNPTIGTINATGLYTAPSVILTTQTVSVSPTYPGITNVLTATVTLNPTTSTPTPTPIPNITVSPSVITVGSNATLAWSCGNSTSATINQLSIFNGIQVGVSGSISVSPTATSVYQLNCSGPGGSASMQATLTVQASTPSPIIVSISPTTGTFASNVVVPFSAVVVNDPSNAGVGWTPSLGSALVPTGPLTANYLTPSSVPQGQAIHITAYSVADPSATATATIIVNPIGGGTGGGGSTCTSAPASQHPPQAGVQPNDVGNMTAGGPPQSFVASLTGDNVTSQAFTWSLQSVQNVADLGTVTPISSDSHEVLYQPPATIPYEFITVELVATSQLYTCLTANAVIQVNAPQ